MLTLYDATDDSELQSVSLDADSTSFTFADPVDLYTGTGNSGTVIEHYVRVTASPTGLTCILANDATGWINTDTGEAPTIVLCGDTPSSSNALSGAYQNTTAAGNGQLVIAVFFENGEYVQAVHAGASGTAANGVERGLYTWDSSTGAFSVTPVVDTNGSSGGLSTFSGALDKSSSTLTLTPSGGSAKTWSAVTNTSGGVAGAWYTSSDDSLIVLLSTGAYMYFETEGNTGITADDASISDWDWWNGFQDGLWSTSSGDLNFSSSGAVLGSLSALDENGETGPDDGDSFSYTISGDTLTVTTDEGDIVFTRVTVN